MQARARAALVLAAAVAVATPACGGHYGYQILSADLGAARLAGSDTPAVDYAGYAAFLGAAPAIHAAHDHWRRAAISLGLRVAATALIREGLVEPDPSGAGDEGMAIRGMLNGLLSLLVIVSTVSVDAAMAR
jgi:hypothetical protein